MLGRYGVATATLLIPLGMLACEYVPTEDVSSAPTDPTVWRIEMILDADSLLLGDSTQAKVTVRSRECFGNACEVNWQTYGSPPYRLYWSTDDSTVITVNQNGRVVSRGVGSAVVIANMSDYASGGARVTVYE